MVRIKRLKQTKHKIQTKNRRQTKHKRHRQYGGLSMTYTDYSGILKQGQIDKKVVIPGYNEIVSSIKEYNNYNSLIEQLNLGILSKDVVRYYVCKERDVDTPKDSIIVLRKKRQLFKFKSKYRLHR